MIKKLKMFIIMILFPILVFSQTQDKTKTETPEERIIRLLSGVLQELPEKISGLKPEMRRIAFYSFRVDRNVVPQELMKSLQGTIETSFTKLPNIKLVNIPELKP